jgi:hypothetical protein
VINHGTSDIEYGVAGRDLITGESVRGRLRVLAGGVRVLVEEPQP